MYSCIISSRTNNKTSNQEDNEPEEILNQGIEKIYHSFNVNNKIYKEKITENENIINGLTKKLEMLNNEMEMLQRENQYYKTQNENLKKEVEKLNKIVKKIQGKLSNVDYQINECIKSGSNIKSLNIKKKKNSNIYFNFKTKGKDKKENNQSFLQLNPNNFLVEENEKGNNGKFDNKSTKNKKLIYYIDNNLLKDNGNKINSKIEYEINNNKLNKKLYKTAGYNSFDLNMNINENKKNIIYTNDDKKLKTPNSILHKNIISKAEENKKNNLEIIDNEQPREISFSCEDNYKNRSNSSKHFIKENAKSNNKTTDEIEINKFINNEDLNIDKITSTKKNDLQSKICLTYDNLFNKKKEKKKNSYTSFRGKILNKNISENFFKNNKINKSDEINYFLKKCKMLLNKEFFEQIVKLFQDYKDGLLTDEGIIIKTQRYLESNKELIELFNKVFGK